MQLKHILYVEDDPDIQEFASMALTELGGYELCVCSSGQEALDALKTYAPQLVLLDMMMPGIDGIATYKALRQMPNGREVPVIFVTAKVQKAETEHYLGLGAIGVISKPFDVTRLSGAIRELWQAASTSKRSA